MDIPLVSVKLSLAPVSGKRLHIDKGAAPGPALEIHLSIRKGKKRVVLAHAHI